MLNVSADSIQRAAVVRDQGIPELAAEVDAGHVSVSAAATVARLDPDEQRQVVERGAGAIRTAAQVIRSSPRGSTFDIKTTLKRLDKTWSAPEPQAPPATQEPDTTADDPVQIGELFLRMPSDPAEALSVLAGHPRAHRVSVRAVREMAAWFVDLAVGSNQHVIKLKTNREGGEFSPPLSSAAEALSLDR